MPRFMVMVKATNESEAGEMPSEDLLAAMGRYNEELVKAGVMLEGERIKEVTAFIVRQTKPEDDREYYKNFPDQPADPKQKAGVFDRFGLPDRVEA